MVEIPMYDYWWGLTERQIDLLLIDQPVINYKHSKTDRKRGKDSVPPAPSRRKITEAEMKWKQKYGNGQKPKLNLNLSEFKIGSQQ